VLHHKPQQRNFATPSTGLLLFVNPSSGGKLKNAFRSLDLPLKNPARSH